MADENKRNLLYFEAPSMAQLFDQMQSWQVQNEKRLLSVSVERDGDKFCCIGLTNPTEVNIVGGTYPNTKVDVSTSGALKVTIV